VAIGSYAFHGTLLYEMQLADELPMLLRCDGLNNTAQPAHICLSSSMSVFTLFDTSPGYESFNKLLVVGLAIANIVFAGT